MRGASYDQGVTDRGARKGGVCMEVEEQRAQRNGLTWSYSSPLVRAEELTPVVGSMGK